jgi:hypothetical protein
MGHSPLFSVMNHVFPRERARKRERTRTRSSNFLPRRSISSSMLEYEKLDVYRIALEFVVTTVEIRDRLPRANGEIQDQFKRIIFDCAQHRRRCWQAQTSR